MMLSLRYQLPLFFIVVFFLSIEASPTVIVPETAAKRVLTPKEAISYLWHKSLSFDDSQWRIVTGAPGGVGYDLDGYYNDYISLDVRSDMHESGENPTPGCFVRIPFTLSDSLLNGIGRLMLRVRYDDGFAVWLNGVFVAQDNAPKQLIWNAAATDEHDADEPEEFDITFYRDRLKNGANLLAVQGLNRAVNSSDFLINVELLSTKDPLRDFEASNLPLVFIEADSEQIPAGQRIAAKMGVVYHGVGAQHSVFGERNNYDGDIGIEVRGSSSSSWRKKQYNVETRYESGENRNVALMGLPAENDWILNAPYIDKSLMRNVLAYDLALRMGRYASRTQYCELFLNGEYRGVYVLMEKIKRDKHRVDIARLDSTDMAGDDLTGGYIIKIDKHWNDSNSFVSKYRAPNATRKLIHFQYHYPAADKITEAQKEYIQSYIYGFEEKMHSDDWTDVASGYPSLINIDSFIDFFIINELAKNVDAYRLSTFLYKDKTSVDDRLYAGPVWDFNLAFGLANYYDGEDTDGWMIEELSVGEQIIAKKDGAQTPFWWLRLFREPAFNRAMLQRWRRLRTDVLDIERIHRFIDAVADTLDEAQQRNFYLWTGPGEPKARGDGFWPVPKIFRTFHGYRDETDYLKWWIEQRILWIDANLPTATSVQSRTPVAQARAFKLYNNYPNPFNSETVIRFDVPTSAFIALRIYNVAGRLVRVLAASHYSPGRYKAIWDGRDESDRPVAGGVYMVQLGIENTFFFATEIRKMLLLK